MDSLYAIKKSIKNYASGGNVLIVATLLAFIIANSPLADLYFSWWAQPISLQVGGFNLFSHGGEPMAVMTFINDALMAIFFFSIGLEIKREVLVGELTSLKQALLPIVAAIGGMVVPVLLFMYVGRGSDFLRGQCHTDGYRYSLFAGCTGDAGQAGTHCPEDIPHYAGRLSTT